MPLPKKLQTLRDGLAKGAKNVKDKSKKKLVLDTQSKLDTLSKGYDEVDRVAAAVLKELSGTVAGIDKARRAGNPAEMVRLSKTLPKSVSLVGEASGKMQRTLSGMEGIAKKKQNMAVFAGTEEF